jgi:hypothetical protein
MNKVTKILTICFCFHINSCVNSNELTCEEFISYARCQSLFVFNEGGHYFSIALLVELALYISCIVMKNHRSYNINKCQFCAFRVNSE